MFRWLPQPGLRTTHIYDVPMNNAMRCDPAMERLTEFAKADSMVPVVFGHLGVLLPTNSFCWPLHMICHNLVFFGGHSPNHSCLLTRCVFLSNDATCFTGNASEIKAPKAVRGRMSNSWALGTGNIWKTTAKSENPSECFLRNINASWNSTRLMGGILKQKKHENHCAWAKAPGVGVCTASDCWFDPAPRIGTKACQGSTLWFRLARLVGAWRALHS